MRNTTLCHIEKDGKYLMMYRNKKNKDENEGKWVGIGGKFEFGESPEECAAREILEETGLTALELSYRGIVTFVSDLWGCEYMHLFHTYRFEGELKECDEGELLWVEKEKLYSLPVWEGDKIFFRLLEENSPFFSLKLEYTGDTLVSAVLNGEILPLNNE